ncbi:MAG: response regulator [Myxococcaceae bacterium]
MPRILVIDDSPMLIELTVKALQSAGFDAAGALDLATLEARLAEGAFDLILVDVNMPEMFGDDVVEFLRAQHKTSAKLILYSDVPEAELDRKVKSSGAHGSFPKSKGIDALITEMGRLLGVTPKTGSVAASAFGAESPVEKGPRRRRILIVDDSEVTTTVIAEELKAKGFEVHTADTADKATRIILKKQTRPDLVLLDVRMPGVNGEQFCRFIKSNSLFRGIRVLLCSSENVEELQRICREAGADGYLPKDAVLTRIMSAEFA